MDEGYLTRAFFESELPGLKAAFAEETGLTKVEAELLLRNGHHIRLEEQPVCTDGYISFDRKDGSHRSRMILPYSTILAVTLVGESEKKVGFVR
jgi:hypothetical protein